MGIKTFKMYLVIAGSTLLLYSCKKRTYSCSKQGYEYSNSTFRCWYNPSIDSVPIGDNLFIEASVPRTFIDENTNSTVTNSSSIINGPLHILMISPSYQAAVDSFELSAEVGKIIKDTINFSIGQLKGFRTMEWDNSSIDSFKIKIKIKPLAKGIYAFSLGQQGYIDKDCALYKYFLSPGNVDQHLNYWMDVFGNVSDEVAFFTYCVKVY
jgi:hypothetical protein